MNICLIGNNLTSLALAKNLINKKIKVFIYYEKKNKFIETSRSIGISTNNLSFFNNDILEIKKSIIWDINKIEIYTESSQEEKILNFEKKDKNLFSTVKNDKLYKSLHFELKKSKFFKYFLIKNSSFYKNIFKNQKFDMIINCETNNIINKKYFINRVNKSYDSFAHTTIITHKKIENTKAIQIFTKLGPIAFLPISKSKTSVVFSIFDKKNSFNDGEIKKLIIKYNKNYEIKNFSDLHKFPLNFSSLKKYYYKNMMAFGDCLHKVHPLAGQGFNMTIRDIKILSNIINNRINLGLQIDFSIYEEFEKLTKHHNYIFSTGIDLIHEFFKFNGKFSNNYQNKILKYIGKNKTINNIISSYADHGFRI